MRTSRKMRPIKIIVLGFLAVIIAGTILLLLPISLKEGVHLSLIDSLFTSTSAVCVTGLLVVDTADTFSAFGQTIIALLIQIGGLGITSIGVILIVLSGGKVGLRKRQIIRASFNLDSAGGTVLIVKAILYFTLIFEVIGMGLSFIVFSQDYTWGKALGISAFHSIASFNNAGFDILGGFRSLSGYKDNAFLCLVTCGLIIFGGIGFYVIKEVTTKGRRGKYSLYSKVVLITTAVLLVSGTLLLKAGADISWLTAFFHSTSARTAGFSTCAMEDLGSSGMVIIMLLMFIGASPGSTGGGVKTTTAFIIAKNFASVVTGRRCSAFKRMIPAKNIEKACIICLVAICFIVTGIFLVCFFQPELPMQKVAFEVISAFGTVGLSTGITPQLSDAARIVITIMMFAGRLGPLTIVTMWSRQGGERAVYSEENISVG